MPDSLREHKGLLASNVGGIKAKQIKKFRRFLWVVCVLLHVIIKMAVSVLKAQKQAEAQMADG